MSYTKQDLVTRVRAGLSIREIGAEIKLSYTAVRYQLKKYRLKTKKRSVYKCRCGVSDPAAFYGNKRSICGKCHNVYCIRKGRETRQRVIALLGGACSACGYSKCNASLDLHHTDSATKDLNFKSMRSWSWPRVLREIPKCILLCKNCHTELHELEYLGA